MWAGRALARNRFRARLRADLTQVFAALQCCEVTAQIAARLPLARAADALRPAESGTVAGKVVLNPWRAAAGPNRPRPSTTLDGVRVHTEETWTGAQVEADVPIATAALGGGPEAWLSDPTRP